MIHKGDYVIDVTLEGTEPRNKLGEVVDIIAQRYYLRPIGGGKEWSVTPGCYRKATGDEVRRELESSSPRTSQSH